MHGAGIMGGIKYMINGLFIKLAVPMEIGQKDTYDGDYDKSAKGVSIDSIPFPCLFFYQSTLIIFMLPMN